MEFGSFNGRDYDEYNSVGFVEIFEIFERCIIRGNDMILIYL